MNGSQIAMQYNWPSILSPLGNLVQSSHFPPSKLRFHLDAVTNIGELSLLLAFLPARAAVGSCRVTVLRGGQPEECHGGDEDRVEMHVNG